MSIISSTKNITRNITRGIISGDGFSPLDVVGVQKLWLDLQDPDTTTVTPITFKIPQITDKFSSGNDATQSIGGEQPVFGSDAKGNFADFGDQFMDLPNGTLPLGNADYSIYVVFKKRNDPSDLTLIGGGTEGSKQQLFIKTALTGKLNTGWFLSNLSGPTSAITDGVNYYISSFYDGAGRTQFINDVLDASDSATLRNTQSSFHYLGAVRSGGAPAVKFDGLIREVLVWGSKLSDGDDASVKQYLANKWGI